MPLPNDGLAAVIARRRQTWSPPTKPQLTGLVLDRQHPLTQGMLVSLPFFEGQGRPVDLARNTSLALTGTPTWDRRAGTLGLRSRATGDQIQLGVDGTDFILPRRQMTALLVRVRSDTTLRSNSTFGINNNVALAAGIDAAVPNSSGNVTFAYGSGAALTWSGYKVTTDLEYWAFVTGPNGRAIYYQGRLVASDSTFFERQEEPGNAFWLNRGATAAGDLETFAFFALLNVDWTAGQVRQWYSDPWQFFKKGKLGNATRIVQSPVPAPYIAGIGFAGTEHRRQPKGDVQLNWRHPLAQNLLVHVSAYQRASLRGARDGIRERVTGRPLIQGSAVLNGQPSQTGPSLFFSPNTSSYLTSSEASTPVALDQVPSLLNLGNVPLTFAIKFKGASAGSGIMACSGRLSATDLGMFLLPSSINFRASTGQSVSTVGDYGDDKWYTAIGRHNGIGSFPEVYIFDEHGTLLEQAVGITAVTTNLPSAGNFTLGTATPAGPGLGSNVNIEWVGVWKAFMPVSGMAQLAQNPYQIFQPPVQERFARRVVMLGNPPKPESITPAIARRRQTWLPPTKPTDRTLELDRQHPLTQGMLICVPFFEGNGTPVDYARNVTPTVSGTPVWDASRGSLAWRARAAGDFLTLGTDGNDIIIPRRRVTVLLIRAKTDTTVRSAALFGLNNTAGDNTAFSAQTGSGTNVITFRWGGSVNMSTNINAALGITDPEAWAFVAGPTEGAHIYRNGIDVGSTNPTAGERQEGPGEAFYLNRLANGGTVTGDLNNYIFFALLDAEWDQAKVRSWVRDPWQFFKKGRLGNATRIVQSPVPAPYSHGIGGTGTVRRFKPPVGTGIDWKHPLTRGLVYHCPFNTAPARSASNIWDADIRDVVSNWPMYVSISAGQTTGTRGAPSPSGSSIVIDASAGAISSSPTNASIPDSRDCPPVYQREILRALALTVAVRVQPVPQNLIGSGGAFFGHYTLSSTQWAIGVARDASGGQAFFRGGIDQANSVAAYNTNQWLTLLGRVRAGTQFVELFVFDEHGTLLERATGTVAPGTNFAIATGKINFAAGQFTSGACNLEYGAAWARALEDEELFAIAQNPYQIFQPPVQERFARRALIPVPYTPPAPPQALRPRTKPEPGRLLDRSHPLVRTLRCYLPFNEEPRIVGPTGDPIGGRPFRDAISGRFFTNGYNFGLGPSPGNPSRTGPTVHMTGDASAQINSSETLALDGTRSQPPTLLADYNVTPITLGLKFGFGTGQGNAHMFGIATASLDRAILQLTPATHLIRFNSGSATVDSVNAYNTTRFYTVFGRMTAPVINSFPELFIYDEDGVLLEHVVSGVQQQWGLNNVAFTFFGIFGAIADYEWAGIWHEVLSDANMAQLARNPYVIYEPPANTKARKLLKFVVSTPGTISPTGIPSEEALGTPNLVRLALYPTGIATREVHGIPHIGDVDPAGIVSAEAFGTARLLAGDLNPDGIASAEVVSDGANLIGDPSPDGTLSPSSIAGAEAMGAPTLTEVQTLHPTGIPSGFDMDNPTVRPPVGTINPFGIASEEAFADVTTTALGTPIGGTSVNGPPINPPAPAAGTVTAKKLCSPFDLILAGLYTTAASPAAILPEVYGDFSAGGLRGPIPTVLVTQSAPWIFIAAMHPVQSIDQVYINDVLQTGGFAAIPQVALGGGPQVALIAFDEQPIGEVTWRGKGKMSSVTGALITDPILQLEDLLLTRGGYATTDFDATTLAEAKSLSAAAGWSTAFVINDTSQMQAWITEILFNVMGFWRVSGRAQLQIMIDPGGSFAQSDLVDSIVANRDVLDGDDGVTFIADRQQLVNRLVANYQYSWQEQRYTAQLADDTLLDAKSSNAYGEVRKEVTLRGHRDATQLAQWATILFARQAFETRVEGGQVEFTTKGPRLIHATVGDLFAFTWPYGPTRENGNPYVNQILRIVEISQEFTRGGATTVRAVDTGAYVQSAGSRLLTPLAV